MLTVKLRFIKLYTKQTEILRTMIIKKNDNKNNVLKIKFMLLGAAKLHQYIYEKQLVHTIIILCQNIFVNEYFS